MSLRNLLFFLAVLWFSISLFAAEENKQENEITKQQKSTSAKPSDGKRARVKTLEEFIPSEEVSADKAVSFPSDI
jgi:hypothetical protein